MIEVLILVLSMAQPAERQSLSVTYCSDPSANVHFACEAHRGERIAICGMPHHGSSQRNLWLELSNFEPNTVPSQVLGLPEAQLFFNHYSRFQTEYLEIAARKDGVEFRLYRHYLGDFGEQEMSYGMVITKLVDRSETHLECAGEVLDELATLPPYIECDTESALGCGAFERPEPHDE